MSQYLCEKCNKIFIHHQVTKKKRICEACCRKNHVIFTKRSRGKEEEIDKSSNMLWDQSTEIGY